MAKSRRNVIESDETFTERKHSEPKCNKQTVNESKSWLCFVKFDIDKHKNTNIGYPEHLFMILLILSDKNCLLSCTIISYTVFFNLCSKAMITFYNLSPCTPWSHRNPAHKDCQICLDIYCLLDMREIWVMWESLQAIVSYRAWLQCHFKRYRTVGIIIVKAQYVHFHYFFCYDAPLQEISVHHLLSSYLSTRRPSSSEAWVVPLVSRNSWRSIC